MSEQDEQRPLTRRERRLRELGETGAMDLADLASDSGGASSTQGAAEPVPAAAADPEPEIEISPFNEDGTPRSRREMRELRAAALAELAAESAPASPEQIVAEPAPSTPGDDVIEAEPVEAEPAADSPAADSPAAESPADVATVVTDVPGAPDAAAVSETGQPGAAPAPQGPAEPDFDTLIAPPTEPFTVEELREAEEPAEGAAEAATAAPAPAPGVGPTQHESPAASLEQVPGAPDAAAGKVPAVDASSQGAEAPVAEEASVAEPVPAAEAVPAADGASAAAADEAILPAEANEDLPAAQPETSVLPEQEAAEPSGDAVEAEPTEPNPAQKSSYSFPDIAPPEEWRSVFDDPSSRQFPEAGKPGGDFDDLISRAVAQEGSTGSTGSSALILPSMPEDTGGLTGPLGATGDLYVTGSLHLPKSLGETGGHSAIHDSIEMDPITGDPMTEAESEHAGPAPVSARHAVSARVDSSVPVVAKPAREKSKLPLVLSITGGGLIIVVVALGAWGASNGFFG